jgi:NAD(P)H dehydrogenase (quinone)
MKFLVIYAHPMEHSYQSALHRCVVDSLTNAGHEVDDFDLYAERFQPVLTSEERRTYHNAADNRGQVLKGIERLQSCQGIVMVFPTWWYGMPAIMKGYFDRVWIPGVAFDVVDGRTRPLLQHITKFCVVTTYGSPWWLNTFMGDPSRRVLMRGISHLFSSKVQKLWLAKYGLDHIDTASRERFLSRVGQRLKRFAACATTCASAHS